MLFREEDEDLEMSPLADRAEAGHTVASEHAEEGIMELTLTTEEQRLLLDILEERHRALLKEIWHTDHREFKETLRRNEELLESIVSRLHGAPVQEVCV